MKRVVVLRDIPQYREALQAVAPGWEIIFTKDRQMAAKYLPEAEVVLGWTGTLEKLCLGQETPLKWVQYWFSGVNTLPLDQLRAQNILLTNASGVHARPVSESVFAMMLALARQIPQILTAQQTKTWCEEKLSVGQSAEIHGKTIGILGTGQIGQEVARIARAFSMRTLGYRRNNGIAPYFDEIFFDNQLRDMLSRCDYVVNLLPLTATTRNLIDKKAFAAMRTGTRYFSFGRGETTVTDDLVMALATGKLAAAGLDVMNPEPFPAQHPLWSMENVILAPHVAYETPHYFDRIIELFCENLLDYVAGRQPSRNVVDFEQAY